MHRFKEPPDKINKGGGKLTEGWTDFAPKGGTWRFDAWKNRFPSDILFNEYVICVPH